MAVNQAQVDHIISSASADDPEVKLLKLQDEVDLIKTSIKRLLIDIRERMNEMENPLNASAAIPTSMGGAKPQDEAKPREKTEPHPESKADSGGAAKTGAMTPLAEQGPWSQPVPVPTASFNPGAQPTRALDEHLLEALRAQVATSEKAPEKQPEQGPEKLRLQKVHRLFEWTGKAVKKYGHDRLEMMLDSYRAMGYIEKEQRDQVKEIARLMPASIGDLHEIGPDEFVQELYSLNRILDPNDTTLDRDMIEVLMEQKRRGVSPKERAPLPEEEREESWLGMQDRV